MEKSSPIASTGLSSKRDPIHFSRKNRGHSISARELGLSDRLVEPDPATKGTYILNHGKLSKLPQGAETGMPTKLMPFLRSDLLSPIGKLRAMMDLVIPRRKETTDESVGDFISRRFGREFLEKIVEPLFAGIFAGDANRLSVKAVVPRLTELESTNGSLIRGVLRARKKMSASSNARYSTSNSAQFSDIERWSRGNHRQHRLSPGRFIDTAEQQSDFAYIE